MLVGFWNRLWIRHLGSEMEVETRPVLSQPFGSAKADEGRRRAGEAG